MAGSGFGTPKGVTFPGVVAGEWLKLRSQRGSVWAVLWALLSAGAVLAVAGFLLRDEWESGSVEALGLTATMPATGTYFAALLLGLGICVWVAGEFVSGSDHLTLLAVPRRRTVFCARLALTAALSLALGGVVALMGAAAAVLSVGIDRVLLAMAQREFALSVAATLAICLSVGLLAFAAASLTRRSLSAVGCIAVLFFVLPALDSYAKLAGRLTLVTRVLSLFPGSLTSMVLMASSGVAEVPLSFLGAVLMLLAWSLAAVIAAAWRYTGTGSRWH